MSQRAGPVQDGSSPGHRSHRGTLASRGGTWPAQAKIEPELATAPPHDAGKAEPADGADPAPQLNGHPPRLGRIAVLLVDDHVIVRQGLAELLAEQPDIDVVGEAGDGEVAIELARQLRPDVIIMDVVMPRMNGIEATGRITTEMPQIRVIALSMHDKQDMAEAMRAAGAWTYLSKGGRSDEMLAAIRSSDTPRDG